MPSEAAQRPGYANGLTLPTPVEERSALVANRMHDRLNQDVLAFDPQTHQVHPIAEMSLDARQRALVDLLRQHEPLALQYSIAERHRYVGRDEKGRPRFGTIPEHLESHLDEETEHRLSDSLVWLRETPLALALRAPVAWEHGLNGYTRHKCKCGKCRREALDYAHRHREVRRLWLAADPGLRPHDYRTFFAWGCRCNLCSADTEAYRNRREAEILNRRATRKHKKRVA